MKYRFDNPETVFFTSDTHFWHKNIIKYCSRPFADVEEMNQALIDNWNSVITRNDTVFHLGDFVFGGTTKRDNILSQLNGDIILIKGNHDDYRNIEHYSQLLIQIGEDLIYLNHYPFLTFAGAYRENVYQLFGHLHSGPYSIVENLISSDEKEAGMILSGDKGRLQYLMSNQYDVGVDNNNYKPINWKDIKIKNNWK